VIEQVEKVRTLTEKSRAKRMRLSPLAIIANVVAKGLDLSHTHGTLRASKVCVNGNQRILVADDDPEMLGAVAEAFERGNYDVVRAGNGAELVEQLANHGPFDLIVADVLMPWMDGLKALSSMRAAGLATPVIVMTALGEQQLPSQVRALSPSVLLRKPFDLDALDSAVAQLMSSGSATPPSVNTAH
jgi:CheY-like chemotaxis protein